MMAAMAVLKVLRSMSADTFSTTRWRSRMSFFAAATAASSAGFCANSASSPALPHKSCTWRHRRFRNLYMPGRPSSFHSFSFSGGPKNKM